MQGRMAAQRHLGRRREPAQVEVRIVAPEGTVNAVSLRLFSAAIACITPSSSQRSSGITAAGLPVSGRSAKASTWKNGMPVIAPSP